MAKCTPTIVPQLVEDKCKGKQYSTDCTIFEDAIPYLFLTENSTVTDVINSSIQSLVDARNRVEQLEILNQGIESDLILKADKNSPVLTGTPTAPTAAAGTNTTQIATTAFVNGGLATKENTFSKNTAFNKNFGTTAGTVVEGGTLGSNAYTSTPYLPLSGGDVSGTIKTGGFRVNGDVGVANGVGLETYYNPSNKTVYSQNYHRGVDDTYYPMSFGASSFNFNASTTFQGSVTASPATLDTQLATLGQVKGLNISGFFTPTDVATGITYLKSYYTRTNNILTIQLNMELAVTSAAMTTGTSFTLPNSYTIANKVAGRLVGTGVIGSGSTTQTGAIIAKEGISGVNNINLSIGYTGLASPMTYYASVVITVEVV